MTMADWSLAFGRYALGAAAVGIWDYGAAMAHHENVLMIAGQALRVFALNLALVDMLGHRACAY